MTKSTVTKLFIGSLFAIAGGVVLLAAGVFLAYVNGTFIMRGPDVVGIHPSAFSTWSIAQDWRSSAPSRSSAGR